SRKHILGLGQRQTDIRSISREVQACMTRFAQETARASTQRCILTRRGTMKHTASTGISRRRLLAMAGVSAGATLLARRPLVAAQGGMVPTRVQTAAHAQHTSFGPLKQIDAGLLNVGYAEAGRANGRPVILLHGWPYDMHSYVDVAPVLAAAGYRVIVPSLRGYGTTRFLATATPRNGQQAVLAVDILALLEALNIAQAILAGYDWGARTANIIAALWPERCQAMVSVSGSLDREPGHQQEAAAAQGRARLMVPMLFRHG